MNTKKQKTELKKCLHLFITFFKIGSFTFGGGYAMIPMIQREIVEKKAWLKKEDILDIIAISESTPGPIAVNSATFVGYQTAGFWGSFAATVGVVLPSFFIILILSYFIRQFESLKFVKYAFNGIRVGVLALMVKALISMCKQCPRNIFSYIVAAAAFLLVVIFNVNVFIVIISSAAVGFAYSLICKKAGKPL